MTTTSPVRVPLLLQPANPPTPFVGRGDELARVSQALTRAPVVVVVGFSGIGKSALVATALASAGVEVRERTLVVDAGECGRVDLLDAVVRAVASLPGCAPAPAGVEERARWLIDTLEAHELWLVVESVDRLADSAGFTRALELALRHGRHARIVCVCREDPRAVSLRTQTIPVPPMSDDELRALLAATQGDDTLLNPAEIAGIVREARGSPWRLLQLSLGGAVDGGPEASLLALAPAAQSLLRTLALVPASVPREALARATRLPAPDVMAALSRRGYLEVSPHGVRLHSAARTVVGASIDPAERALRSRKLLDALLAAPEPEAAVQAAALAVTIHDDVALSALLVRGRAALRGGDVATGRAIFEAAGAADAPLIAAEAALGHLAVRLCVGELEGFDAALSAVALQLRERLPPATLTNLLDEVRRQWSRLAGADDHDVELELDLDAALRAGTQARDAGDLITALEAGAHALDAAIGAGDRRAAQAQAEALTRDAANFGSARFALDARLALSWATGALHTEALVELAQRSAENPVVARRARALLGEATPLGPTDAHIVDVLRGGGATKARVVRGGEGAEWTVDAGTMRVHFADGRTIDLATRKVLFDLLATLCRRGGAATKEQLLEVAWGVKDYHPLHHDNRLKVAVRKLRRVLEEALGHDPIDAADDGYRLRGKVRLVER